MSEKQSPSSTPDQETLLSCTAGSSTDLPRLLGGKRWSRKPKPLSVHLQVALEDLRKLDAKRQGQNVVSYRRITCDPDRAKLLDLVGRSGSRACVRRYLDSVGSPSDVGYGIKPRLFTVGRGGYYQLSVRGRPWAVFSDAGE